MKNKLAQIEQQPPSSRFFVFDPEKLHAVARRAVGLPFHQMVQQVIDDLAREYPKHIETKQEWIFSCAGGAVGVMTVLHASLSEYVAIFGSAVGTEGFSGRYRIGIHDFVLAGEMWTYTGDNIGERVITRPGERAYLRTDQVKGFKLPEGGWMLEYGQGPIPTALPFALGDALFSAMDLETLWKTVWIYGRLVVKELVQGKI